ncbi:MAG: CPBP family intramembrane glutamic endopeptidase [Pyrinomonadaceae bacterium]
MPDADVSPLAAEGTLRAVSPDDPPWSALIGFALWFLSVILIVFMPLLFLLPYLASSGKLLGDQKQLAQFVAGDPTSILLQLLAVVPAHIFTLIFAWLVVTRRGHFSFWETLGFKSGGILWWHYVLIFFAFASFAVFVNSFFSENENEFTRLLKSSRSAVYVIALIATLSAPLVEEVVYRGVLYSALQRTTGVPAAIAVVTLLFASVHALQYYETPSILFLLTVLSLILTVMRAFSKNLLPCIIFHTIVNGVQSVGLLLEPYVTKTSETSAFAFFPFN